MRILASDVMERHVLAVSPRMRVLELHHLFAQTRLQGAPVIDDGEVVGVVSALDLVKAVDRAQDSGVDPDIVLPPDVQIAAAPDLAERLEHLTVGDVMATDVVTASPTTPVVELARIMRERRIPRVLVVEHGRVRGIVSAFDLVPLVERALGGPRGGADATAGALADDRDDDDDDDRDDPDAVPLPGAA